MKKIFLIIALFLTAISYAQKPKVDVVRHKEITTAERDALVVPAGEYWRIYNSTVGQFQYWNGLAWVSDGTVPDLTDYVIAPSAFGTTNGILVATGAGSRDTYASNSITTGGSLGGLTVGALNSGTTELNGSNIKLKKGLTGNNIGSYSDSFTGSNILQFPDVTDANVYTVTLPKATGVAALEADPSGFDGNLTTTDNTLQEIAQKVDDLVIGTGGGDVTKVGTPLDNQIAIWTGDGTIEGNANFTWDGTDFNINSGLSNSLNFDNGTFRIDNLNTGSFQSQGNQLRLQTGTSALNGRLYNYNNAGTFYTALQFENPTLSAFVNVRNLGGTVALTSEIPTNVSELTNDSGYLVSADLIAHLEYDNTEKTVWNNGFSNTSTNTSFGSSALRSNTTGGSNTAFGDLALRDLTTGSYNTAIGRSAGYKNQAGRDNTSVGQGAGNLEGSRNTSIGSATFFFASNGNDNVALGAAAGDRYGSGVGTGLTTVNESIFIGNSTRASADNSINEIVIGHESLGNGNNTITLGNTSHTDTYLKGELHNSTYGSGTITGTPTYNLQVDASGNIIESALDSGVSTFIDGTDTPATYTGQAGLFPKVNSGETALEFTDLVQQYDPLTHLKPLKWIGTQAQYDVDFPAGHGDREVVILDATPPRTYSN
jgi:hypothetical protein